MDNPVDLLKAKISEAKSKLPETAKAALDAVDWRPTILEIKEKKGYTIEQLGNLDTETELLLCGLLSPQDYPRELEKRMGISKEQANDLVKEMNEKVFLKIKEALIKTLEPKKPETAPKDSPDVLKKPETKDDSQILDSAGIKIIEKEPAEKKPAETPPIIAQKLSGFTKSEITKTEHTLENITKASVPTPTSALDKKSGYAVDPYREKPE